MKENMWVLGCPKPNCGELANGYYNAGPMLQMIEMALQKKILKCKLFQMQ